MLFNLETRILLSFQNNGVIRDVTHEARQKKTRLQNNALMWRGRHCGSGKGSDDEYPRMPQYLLDDAVQKAVR